MGVSLKLFRSRAIALPALYGYREVGHFLSGNTRVSLPSYERYQRLQLLKRANICSAFAQTTASQLYGELPRPGYRTPPNNYFVEHAHNASLCDIRDFGTHTTPRVLHFSALVIVVQRLLVEALPLITDTSLSQLCSLDSLREFEQCVNVMLCQVRISFKLKFK